MEKLDKRSSEDKNGSDAREITASAWKNVLISVPEQNIEIRNLEREFYRFVEQNRHRILLSAYSITKCWATAEDVVQTTILNLHSRLFSKGDHIRNMGAWLYTAVRNTALNEAHRKRTSISLTDAPELPSPSTPCPMEQEEEAEELDRRIARLPEQQRTVVCLRLWKQMTYEAIGEKLGIDAATAERYYRKARQTLGKR